MFCMVHFFILATKNTKLATTITKSTCTFRNNETAIVMVTQMPFFLGQAASLGAVFSLDLLF